VVGGFRAYFGRHHQIPAVHVKLICKAAAVPFLEQRHIKAYMGRI